MQTKKIAIVDCNNFYVSCERLFNPALKSAPVVVLSNNDGCAIARSSETKDLKVKMGAPIFKLDDDIKKTIVKFSSNYALYGDISDRISNILKKFSPAVEIYSIDESFIDITHIEDSHLIDYMLFIKNEIFRLTGIPVSLGVGPTKTLAKLMIRQAKKDKSFNGVASYYNCNINNFSLTDVWNLGAKSLQKLNNINVFTVEQFLELPQFTVKKLLTVLGVKTQLELKEILVYNIDVNFKKPKVIQCSRTFGRTIWDNLQLQDAIQQFIKLGCNKMVSENLKARTIHISLETNRHNDNYFVWHKKIKLYLASNDLQQIVNEVQINLNFPQRLYAKASITFTELISDNVYLPKLFTENYNKVQILDLPFKMYSVKREFLSNAFTTNWNEILKLN